MSEPWSNGPDDGLPLDMENELMRRIEDRARDEIYHHAEQFSDWLLTKDPRELTEFISSQYNGDVYRRIMARSRIESDYIEYRCATITQTERDELLDQMEEA